VKEAGGIPPRNRVKKMKPSPAAIPAAQRQQCSAAARQITSILPYCYCSFSTAGSRYQIRPWAEGRGGGDEGTAKKATQRVGGGLQSSSTGSSKRTQKRVFFPLPLPLSTTVLHDGHHGPSSTVLDKLVDWNGQQHSNYHSEPFSNLVFKRNEQHVE
jgi:hypothetical protein